MNDMADYTITLTAYQEKALAWLLDREEESRAVPQRPTNSQAIQTHVDEWLAGVEEVRQREAMEQEKGLLAAFLEADEYTRAQVRQALGVSPSKDEKERTTQ